MKSLSSISLRAKITFIVMATTCVALAAVLLALCVFDQIDTRARLRRDGLTRALIVADNCTGPLRVGDPHPAQDALMALSEDPHLAAGAVYDFRGEIVARYVRRGWEIPLPKTPAGSSVSFLSRHLEVMQPVMLHGRSIGMVVLQMDLAELDERLLRGGATSALVSLVALGIGYLLATRLQRFISRPILQLAETSRAIAAEKNYSIRVPRESSDELGQLVDGYNEMLSQIELRDTALQQAQAQLEKRVGERTRDLFESNARLHEQVKAAQRAREESAGLAGQLQVAFDKLQSESAERAEARRALQRSEERFATAFRACPVPMAILKCSSRTFVDVNDRFLRLVLRKRDEVIGAKMFSLPLWSAQETRGRIEQLLADGEPLQSWECRILGSNSETRPAVLSGVSFMLGDESCVLLITEDISERASLEGQLRQAQKMDAIGQLAAGVAHDFNNLLTVIQGHAQIVMAMQTEEGMAKEAMSRVVGATQRAAQLTGQLLTFSRKQVAIPRQIVLNSVVGSCASMLKPLLGENVNLHLHLATGLPSIEGDAGMLEQVIVNLAVNARDAMRRGGDLILSTFTTEIDSSYLLCRPQARPGTFVCLQVSDSGCGMDAATLERIFEPFFTTKEVGKGTGLGLATAYGIVKQHRGWIEVVSQAGVGTTFKIFLPVLSVADRGVETTPTSDSIRGGSETILVVEDEPALRDLVSAILRRHGYKVIEAGHGKEAVSVWQGCDRKPDLLLTDMMMPEGMTGWELAQKLRQDTTDLKVVYTSGYSPELFNGQVQLHGSANFLPKPFHPSVLAKAVRQCLDN
ncbi:MAG: response regulator [Verrucomicrobia bacterium]|nr:response regulator [Verrucomicrobiota bacterium]